MLKIKDVLKKQDFFLNLNMHFGDQTFGNQWCLEGALGVRVQINILKTVREINSAKTLNFLRLFSN